MTTAGGPVAAGVTTRGATQTLVTVQSVSGSIAVVTDQTGRQMQVRRDLQRTKGYLPQAGEQWIIDKAIQNMWTFALCITPSNSVDTDVSALQYFVQEASNVFCTVALTTQQSLSASTDTFATTGWHTTSDFLAMATLTATGTAKSFITLPITGLYRISFHAAFGSVSGAAMVAYVCYNTPASASAIARDNRASVPSGGDGTWVHADREVYFVAGSKLYWGYWCSSITTLNTLGVSQPTELEVRCVLPAAQS